MSLPNWESAIRRSTGWRQQERIDRGEAVGLTSPEKAELTAARKKIAALGQVAVATKAVEALKTEADPKVGTRRST